MSESDSVPSVCGLHVAHYKNLHDMWIGHSRRTIITGPNGVGKTNLLEAMAVVAGTAAARKQVEPRLATSQPLDVTLFVRERDWITPPAECLEYAYMRSGKDWTAPELKRVVPGLEQLVADADWWDEIGAEADDSVVDGLLRCVTDEADRARVSDLVRTAVHRGIVAYRVSGTPRSPQLSRVLCLPRSDLHARPKKKFAWTTSLPELFRPLQDWAASPPTTSPEVYVPVLRLPDRGYPPVDFSWLPRERSDEEIADDLAAAAEQLEKDLADEVESLLWGVLDDPRLADIVNAGPEGHVEGGMVDDVIRGIVQHAIDHQLRGLLPHLWACVEYVGPHEVTIELGAAGVKWDTYGGDFSWLMPFSAAERKWIDEAFAAAATDLRRYAAVVRERCALMGKVENDKLAEVLGPPIEGAKVELEHEEWLGRNSYWSLVSAFDAYFLRTVSEGEERSASQRAFDPQPRGLVRAVDEPEAHLHPKGIRQAAEGLDHFARNGDLWVVSHHPYFVDRPDWHHVALSRDGQATRATAFSVSERVKLRRVCEDMGIRPVELMGSLNGVLYVEGEHDCFVLERMLKGDLEMAAVRVVPFRGAFELDRIPELELIKALLSDFHVGFMLDNIRPGRATDESTRFDRLHRDMASQGVKVSSVPLSRPDIVAYLNEEAVRQVNPKFAGWRTVIAEYHAVGADKFKRWLRETHHVDLTNTNRIRAVLDHMELHQLPLEPEVVSQVKGFCARVSA